MSMEDLWPRQSVHGWVLFLGIKSVYNDYKQQIKVKEITEASASVGLLLATAVAFHSLAWLNFGVLDVGGLRLIMISSALN